MFAYLPLGLRIELGFHRKQRVHCIVIHQARRSSK
nr:MAG TPA: hypothetical protein [Caudoviricetes sp.]